MNYMDHIIVKLLKQLLSFVNNLNYIIYINIMKFTITEQPGRLIAIFLLGPYLIFTGKKYNNLLLILLGIIFIIYEIFWIINYNPRNINITITDNTTDN